MNLLRFGLLLGLGGGTAFAAAPAPSAAPAESPRSRWVFSLLPKSLDRHPSLDFHVITEMTPDGEKVGTPTAGRPTYYIAQPGKFSQLGDNTPAGEHAPDVHQLTRAMEQALAAGHYLPATPATALPAIAVVYNYGSFARFSTTAYDFEQMVALEQMYQNADPSQPTPDFTPPGGEDRDVDSLLPIVLANARERSDVLKRAALIGGDKFAHDLEQAINEEAGYKQANAGSALPNFTDASSPFHRFVNANADTMALVEESFSSCYFVVASAYDYVAMKKGKKVLLWRTKMTVNSSGISMQESLPSLVATAGAYVGHETPATVTLTRRISREGTVEVGTPRVIDYSEPTPATGPTPKVEPPRAPGR